MNIQMTLNTVALHESHSFQIELAFINALLAYVEGGRLESLA